MNERNEAFSEVVISGFEHLKTGKVREIFDAGNHLLLVATDRVSAFDYVIENPIPGKGALLTSISDFWFRHFEKMVPNHLADAGERERVLSSLGAERSSLEARTMVVKKCEPLPIECVVRGYLTGSGLSDYRKTGGICGFPLPEGLTNGSKLPEPIFTPATKAEEGHDENISVERAMEMVGDDIGQRVKELSIALYSEAHHYALSKGLVVADTKFEFGMCDGELTLIDEVVTPDSSRLWPAHCLMEGADIQFSFDKQIVRNYLLSTGWDRNSPPPPLPDSLVSTITKVYGFVHQLLED